MVLLQGIYKVEQYLDEDGTLDEIMMQGEFNEEIDIVKEWVEEWKEMNNEEDNITYIDGTEKVTNEK